MRIQERPIAVLFWLAIAAARAESPTDAIDPNETERQQAFKLYQQHRMPEAAELFERVVSRHPSDVAAHEAFGVALVSRAASEADAEKARNDRLHARRELLRAKELGDTSDLCQILLAQIPETGEVGPLSERPEVDTALQAGEAAFAKADWQAAIAAYSRAWDLGHSSRAALYLGDTYFGMKEMDHAGEWFAKAIEVEPNVETPYRYWGDALMAQGKIREARAKYIEGIVADPYQTASLAGLRKWLTANNLSWKKIPITLPPAPSVGKDGKTTINVDGAMLEKPDAGAAWLVYSAERAQWQKDEFLKKFPQDEGVSSLSH